MEGTVCRYRSAARRRDIRICGLVALVGTAGLASPLNLDTPESALAAGGALLLASVVTAIRWRWRRWAGADAQGLYAGGAPGDPQSRLSWAGLEEIVLLKKGGFVARGDGVEVRVDGDLEGADELRDRVLRIRAPELFRRARKTLESGGTLDFQGPETPSAAAARAMAHFSLFVLPPAVALFAEAEPLGIAYFAVGTAFVAHRMAKACVMLKIDGTGLTLRTLMFLAAPGCPLSRWYLGRRPPLAPTPPFDRGL